MTIILNTLSKYRHAPLHISHVLKINMRITLRTNQAHLGLRRNDRQPRYREACSSLLHAARSVYTGALRL